MLSRKLVWRSWERVFSSFVYFLIEDLLNKTVGSQSNIFIVNCTGEMLLVGDWHRLCLIFHCIYFINTSRRPKLLSLKMSVYVISLKATKFSSAIKEMIGLKKAEALPFGFLRRKASQHSAQSSPAYQMEGPLLPVFHGILQLQQSLL